MSTYDTNIPGASGYAGAALLAKRAYDNALASVNQRRQGTLSQYGYKGDVDSSGQLTNFAVDPYNPYGQFQQMRRGNARASQDVYGADVERGIGSGGGLAAQDQADLKYGFGLADKAMGEGLSQTLSGYGSELTNAAYNRDSALWQAEQAAAQSAVDNNNFNPATDPAGDPTTDPTAGGVTYGQDLSGVNWAGLAAASKKYAGSTGSSKTKLKAIASRNTAGSPASRKTPILPPKNHPRAR